jgi:hypothetical protein
MDSSAQSRTIREADRSHASGAPSSSEGRMRERLDQAENTMEAPIVIYSKTTSTHADVPRGTNFLYSLNRLNVATARAKAWSILVCSPLFEPKCRTPEPMRMANAFCRYLEMAERQVKFVSLKSAPPARRRTRNQSGVRREMENFPSEI